MAAVQASSRRAAQNRHARPAIPHGGRDQFQQRKSGRHSAICGERDRLAQYFQVRKGGGVDVGYSLTPLAEIRAGEDLARYSTYLKLGAPIADNSSIAEAVSSVRFTYLGQDDAVIPRSGVINQTVFQRFSARAAGGAYSSLQSRTSVFRPTSANGSLFGVANGGTTFGTRGLDLQSFTLGGPVQLGAYGRNELIGNQYFLFQAGYLHKLFRLSPLTGSTFYVVGLYEVGKVYGDPLAPKLPNDGSFALVGKTALGPVFVGGSVGDGGRRKWWLALAVFSETVSANLQIAVLHWRCHETGSRHFLDWRCLCGTSAGLQSRRIDSNRGQRRLGLPRRRYG